ncbi:MAG: magnesium transporter [Planctomycetota bacterium]
MAMESQVAPEDLRDAWPVLSREERIEGFTSLPRDAAPSFFLELPVPTRAQLLEDVPAGERSLWLHVLPPDDAADVIQQFPAEQRATLLALLEPQARREVSALLAYAEDVAGGLMSPRFVRVRADMSVDEAIRYVRRQARDPIETIYYVYALDAERRPVGVVSFRELLTAPADRTIREIMQTDVITVREDEDKDTVARLIARHDLLAMPVVDAEGRMKGIVTVDDMVDVMEQSATAEIQRIGGMEALDLPYLQTRLLPLLRKRGVWLAVLFVGEMLTASAMSHFEDEIAKAVVLALFVPLIVSAGGNAGSQAATLIVRALALGEVRLRDAWRIVRREFASGIALGAFLACLGLLRIVMWQGLFGTYGEHYALIAVTVGLSVIAIVTFGTIAGSMLPLLLHRIGFDAASASAPFVATLVDVTGLVIYFTVAHAVLAGTLL